jgi:hypothetical protein
MNIERIKTLRSREMRKKGELDQAREKKNQIRLENLLKKK